MTIKIESNRLFNVYFGGKKNVSVTMIEAKDATEAIEQAKKDFHTSLDCTAVESSAIYSGAIGIECDSDVHDEGSVFEIVVRGTSAEKVEKLKKAIAFAIGGHTVEFSSLSHNGGTDYGVSFQRAIEKAGMSVVDL